MVAVGVEVAVLVGRPVAVGVGVLGTGGAGMMGMFSIFVAIVYRAEIQPRPSLARLSGTWTTYQFPSWLIPIIVNLVPTGTVP